LRLETLPHGNGGMDGAWAWRHPSALVLVLLKQGIRKNS